VLFVEPAAEVYEGMVVGEHSRHARVEGAVVVYVFVSVCVVVVVVVSVCVVVVVVVSVCVVVVVVVCVCVWCVVGGGKVGAGKRLLRTCD
jgi:uncharacterized membrane protein